MDHVEIKRHGVEKRTHWREKMSVGFLKIQFYL